MLKGRIIILLIENVYLLEATKKSFTYKDKELYSMVYAIFQKNGITLIDSGFPFFSEEILKELNSLNEQIPLKQILLTHADLDHIGNAYELQQKTGCKVYISEQEMPYINGQKKRFGMKQEMFDSCGISIPDLTYYSEANFEDFTIISTPGHSDGHVSILYKDVLFVGDLCSNIDNKLTGPNPLFTENMIDAQESLRKLKKFHFKIICPAHGKPAYKNSL